MADLTGMMQAAAGGAGGGANYIEDVFSTYLYTGTGATQTITNDIDLDGEGGLVWLKGRSGATDHALYDTARGVTKDLVSNSTAAQTTQATGLTAFSSTGFSIGALAKLNTSSATYASWTFRKQPKFFDVVTYTGNGVVGRTVPHNLGSAPGCIIAKCTSMALDWVVNPCTLGPDKTLYLNATSAMSSDASNFTNTPATSTVFSVGDSYLTNKSGDTYVAYLFAHNAGGFGLSGEDNVVSCGSYTGDGTNGQSVSIGYEPQWLLIKRTDTATSWFLQDNMRPFSVTATEWLQPNTANAESAGGVAYVSPTATGFTFTSGGSSAYNASGGTYIYIAIRRGPMAVPELGTTVYNAITRTGTGADATISGVGFAPDAVISKNRGVGPPTWWDKLRGAYPWLKSSDTGAEGTTTNALLSYTNDGITVGPDTSQGNINYPSFSLITYFFQRAPSFFDEVCYTGTGSVRTVAHNLAAVPQLMIVKKRSDVNNWLCYFASIGNDRQISLNLDAAQGGSSATLWNNTTPTASVFTVATNAGVNESSATYVAYLFATCPGVSKVGSYTGTATTQVINCGFTTGARFVLIKRTDSTGDWYVWDSARGIIAGNDPYLLLNSTAVEVTSTDYVDTAASGFELTSTAPAAINASGGSFVFLAIS